MKWRSYNSVKSSFTGGLFHIPTREPQSSSLDRKNNLASTNLSMHDETERREEIFSALSGATGLILATLQDAASLAPVPYLGEAAGLAIGIWNAVQATKNTKSSFLSLGEDACSLVYTVTTTCDELLRQQRQPHADTFQESGLKKEGKDSSAKGPHGSIPNSKRGLTHGSEHEATGVRDTTRMEGVVDRVDESKEVNEKNEQEGAEVTRERLNPQLEGNLEKLCYTLKEISRFAKHAASRNSVVRFLTASADAGKVAVYQGQLKSALDLFTLQANITIQHVLSRVEAQQNVIHQRLLTSSSPLISTAGNISAPDRHVSGPASGPLHAETRPEDNGLGSVAFPTVFSFAGATIRTGATKSISRSKSPISAKSTEENKSTGSSTPETTSDLEQERVGDELGGGAIKFTYVSGDQTSSVVNDHSQRWNYGNDYHLGDNRLGPTRGDQFKGVAGSRGRRGRLGRNPYAAYMSGRAVYDDNSVPTAIPRATGRNNNRGRQETEDTFQRVGRYGSEGNGEDDYLDQNSW